MGTTAKKSPLAKQIVSIQVIHYCCANCSEEVEEVKFCPSCKAPMRVIHVTEKFGEEAEKYLETLKVGTRNVLTTDADLDSIETNGSGSAVISIDDAPEVLETIGSIKPEQDEWDAFANIAGEEGVFGVEDEEEAETKSKDKKKLDSVRDLVDELDKDDETGDMPSDELGEL
jgi:hypothetical protein